MKVLNLLLFSIFFSLPFISNSQKILIADGKQINDTLTIKADQEASFPGGDQGWRRFLERNINPMVTTDNGAPVGLYTVIIQFIVNIDGTTSDFIALTDFGYGMEQEAIRVFKLSGTWKPSMQNGKPIKAFRKQPMSFVAMSDEFDIITKEFFTLFAGIDNELTVTVNKVKNEDIKLSISDGSITADDSGKYIVRIAKPGRVTITIFNNKKSKEIGVASFVVKPAPEVKN